MWNKCVLTKAGVEKRVVSVDWNFQDLFLEVELGSKELGGFGQAERGRSG